MDRALNTLYWNLGKKSSVKCIITNEEVLSLDVLCERKLAT
jgi:hypothetical protein